MFISKDVFKLINFMVQSRGADHAVFTRKGSKCTAKVYGMGTKHDSVVEWEDNDVSALKEESYFLPEALIKTIAMQIDYVITVTDIVGLRLSQDQFGMFIKFEGRFPPQCLIRYDGVIKEKQKCHSPI